MTGFGLKLTVSTTSLSPATRDSTGTEGPELPLALTTSVGSDSPAVSPAEFLAITLTLSRLPTSEAGIV